MASGKGERPASRQQTGADLGTFGVQHDRARDAGFGAQAFHLIDTARMLFMAAMAEVQARNVHPRVEQGAQRVLAIDGGSQRADYLGPACHTSPLRANAGNIESIPVEQCACHQALRRNASSLVALSRRMKIDCIIARILPGRSDHQTSHSLKPLARDQRTNRASPPHFPGARYRFAAFFPNRTLFSSVSEKKTA